MRHERQGLVIYARHKARVTAFYTRTLGLTIVETSRVHDVLSGRGIELVVHAIPRAIAREITIDIPPRVREETPLKPSFAVRSLERVRAAAAETGGFLVPAERAWRWDDWLVLDGHDPEGNVVQFRQRAGPSPKRTARRLT